MAFSLRKMMNRRDSKMGVATDETSADHRSRPQLSGEGSPSHLHEKSQSHRSHTSSPLPQNGSSSIPAPPKQLIQAQQSTSRRFSPSTNVLDKYKDRTPNILAVPARTANRVSLSRNCTASLEHADQSRFASSRRELRRVRGVDFQMLSPQGPGPNMERSKTDDQTPNESSEREGPEQQQRTTRCGSRRQERADSHQDPVTTQEKKTDSLQVPPTDPVRKPSPTRTASPQAPNEDTPVTTSSNPKKGSIDNALSQLEDPELVKEHLPQPPSPVLRREGDTVDDNVRLSPQSSPKSSPNSKASTAPSNSPKSIIPPSPEYIIHDSSCYDEDSDFADASEAPMIDRGRVTVFVRPPVYNLSRSALQQWESDQSSNSRPSRAWGAAKRWTCCVCDSNTIVEQTVCSKLLCGHDRCPNGCQVAMVGQRRSGPFSQVL